MLGYSDLKSNVATGSVYSPESASSTVAPAYFPSSWLNMRCLSDTTKYEELKKYSQISTLEIYETKKHTKFNHRLDKLLKKGNSISVFASPSSFEVFISIYNSFNTEIFSIGETTSEYIKSQGFDVITSKKQTFESLVNEILNNNYQL